MTGTESAIAATDEAGLISVVHLLQAATASRLSTHDTEVEAILQAMIRLLLGTPVRSDGKLTVKSLAAEAGLLRNKLTHKHTGLKDLFNALVQAHGQQPVTTVRLQQDNDDLRRTVTDLRCTNHQLAAKIATFARVVHVLEVENLRLRDHLAGAPDGNVRLLRTQASKQADHPDRA